jgi:hypothetical protein
LLELLHKVNDIAPGVTTEAHKTSGARENGHVRAATVGMERASADEHGAGRTQFNTVLADHIGDWVLLAETVGINSYRRNWASHCTGAVV